MRDDLHDSERGPERVSGLRKALTILGAAIPGALIGVLAILQKLQISADYGWAMFVLIPFAQGVMVPLFLAGNSRREPRFGHIFTASFYSLLLTGAALLAAKVEGLICLLMALPVAILPLLLGTLAGTALVRARVGTSAKSVVVLALPTLAVAISQPVPLRLHTVRTVRVVAAPPERIWPLLQNLPSIPPPKSWVMQLPFAHPIAIRTSGMDRQCVLTTGVMPEKIERLEENRVLRFRVLQTPPSMKEINPFGEIHPHHLTGNYESQWGQLRLTPLADGRTRVEATSVHGHRFDPDFYWRLWSDAVVRGVQGQVLDEIERRATSAK